MHSPVPLTRDLVLIGGGHAHALVLRRWGMSPLPGARLTVINPAPTAPYTGMLPGHIAGHYSRAALEIDMVRLARFAGARLILGTVTAIDRQCRAIMVPGRPPIRYDVASLDVGITSDMPNIPGFRDHAVAAKPLGPFATRWAAFCGDVAHIGLDPSVAVIGAGVAGVELALAMHHRLAEIGTTPRIALIESGAALQGVAGDTRAVLFERLRLADIRLIENDPVAEIGAGRVRTSTGRRVQAALVVGAAGATPHPWISDLGLEHQAGFLSVDQHMRSVSDATLFAAGDCAHMGFAPRPKAGVFAVRAAPVLAHNLRAALTGAPLRPFRPQKHYLKLVSLGEKEATADRSGITLTGPALWRWKDRIDRRFMTSLTDLPKMPPGRLPVQRARGVAAATPSAPLCAGCGSKIGSSSLSAALSQLPAPRRDDIASRPGDDAAILRTGGVTQVLSTDHLRAFTEDPVLFARIATLHALGDLWAMGATPQAATATVILPHMTAELAEATLSELLGPAAEVLQSAGGELVGGHTTFGPELTFGLTLTGLCKETPVTLSGAQPGDALVLTRPIGSGTLLAADMRLKASGEDLAALFQALLRPQADAARCLTLAGAHAMTDVTGFGLAGHLMNLCDASGVGADLDLNRVPAFPGAKRLAACAIRSTLWPENRAALQGRVDGPVDTPLGELLFDPQTAGGLLAALPAEAADRSVADLKQLGHVAARIGTITDGSPRLQVR